MRNEYKDVNYPHTRESYYQKVWRVKRIDIETEAKMTAVERLAIERHGQRIIDTKAKARNRGVGGVMR